MMQKSETKKSMVLSLAGVGMPYQEIARVVDVTPAYVGMILRQNGIRKREPYRWKDGAKGRPPSLTISADKTRSDEMEVMFRQGKSLQYIGDVFDLTRERVRQILKARGVGKSDGGQTKKLQNAAVVSRKQSAMVLMSKYGCTPAQHAEMRLAGVFVRYSSHKSRALRRGIEWNLTHWEWWSIWKSSGKWGQRGHQLSQFCMSRNNDIGAYTVGNVTIKTNRENWAELKSNNQIKRERNARN